MDEQYSMRADPLKVMENTQRNLLESQRITLQNQRVIMECLSALMRVSGVPGDNTLYLALAFREEETRAWLGEPPRHHHKR